MIEYSFLWCCAPFFAAAAFHLISCLAGKERYADLSKVILMPLLIAGIAAFYIIRFKAGQPAEGSIIPVILVCTALAAGNAGDIFLLGDVKPSTMIKGLCAFLAGHFLYIAVLSIFVPFRAPSFLFILIAVVLYSAALYLSWLAVKKPRGLIGAGVLLYGGILAAFSILVLLRIAGFTYAQDAQHLIVPLVKLYTGTLLFLVSDSVLSHTIFIKPFFQSRFVVMSTYIGAQFCIAWGFCSLF
ncbi:lysoplasmalogenase family protein [Treponema sp. HNW]|uniref:lysoplasmalogenase family protein n=1 Tax=Treponema sp. HNW TaxID=3116654 RepID=UPI003D0AB98F